jgi:hypothetical protein
MSLYGQQSHVSVVWLNIDRQMNHHSNVNMKVFLTTLIIFGLLACSSNKGPNPVDPIEDVNSHQWTFDGEVWSSATNPPDCAQPLDLATPVDLSLASSKLMPGQIRGGDFKPHGGLAFDTQPNGLVDVIAPLSAQVVSGAKYLESGEQQYLFTFINDCGIAYRFDHLKTLSPALQEIADGLPQGSEGDSQTTVIYGASVLAGALIATEIGLTGNQFLDWGVYDLRQKNGAAQDSSWANLYPPEFAHYGICWLEELAEPGKTTVGHLPSRNGDLTSDYCIE